VIDSTAGVAAVAAVAAPGSGPLLAVQTSQPPVLQVYGADGAERLRAPQPLPEGSAPFAVVGGPADPAILVPAPEEIFRIDPATGDVESAPVDGDAISAVALDDGYAVGTADGS